MRRCPEAFYSTRNAEKLPAHLWRGNKMTKKELLEAFTTIKNNLTLAWSLLPILEHQEYYDIVGQLTDQNHNIKPLLDNLKNHKDKLKYYFFTTELLNAIRECLEITKEYCSQNGKGHNYNKFYSNDTITFARYIRNCIAHEFIFSFKYQKDKDRVTNNPPKWRGKIIHISLDGKKFDKNFMAHQDVVDLLNDLEATITTEIY